MQNKELIQKFYTSFSNGNINEMWSCYHPNIVFKDSVFGKLQGEQVFKMWEMLLTQSKQKIIITFKNTQANANVGKADWTAEYYYGKKKRKVINKVSASFKFKEGKIIEHIDTFNLWKWSSQALGLPGLLLGWTAFMKNKIHLMARQKLDNFMVKGN